MPTTRPDFMPPEIVIGDFTDFCGIPAAQVYGTSPAHVIDRLASLTSGTPREPELGSDYGRRGWIRKQSGILELADRVFVRDPEVTEIACTVRGVLALKGAGISVPLTIHYLNDGAEVYTAVRESVSIDN